MRTLTALPRAACVCWSSATWLSRQSALFCVAQDGVDPQRLLGQPGLTAMALQMSRVKANDFIGVAWQVVPQVGRPGIEAWGSCMLAAHAAAALVCAG